MKAPAEVIMTRRDGNGKILSQRKFKNVTTTVLRSELIQKMIQDDAASQELGKVKYGVVGSDATPETESDTTLGNETHRVAISDTEQTGPMLEITLVFSGAWTGTIYEVGVVGGVGATATKDTGSLYLRSAIPAGETKQTVDESISFVWTVNLADA